MPIFRIAHDTAIDAPYEVDAEKLIAGDPRQGVANLYSDPTSQFHCGVWAAEPATWRVRYSEHEFCHLLEGRIQVAVIPVSASIPHVKAGRLTMLGCSMAERMT